MTSLLRKDPVIDCVTFQTHTHTVTRMNYCKKSSADDLIYINMQIFSWKLTKFAAYNPAIDTRTQIPITSSRSVFLVTEFHLHAHKPMHGVWRQTVLFFFFILTRFHTHTGSLRDSYISTCVWVAILCIWLVCLWAPSKLSLPAVCVCVRSKRRLSTTVAKMVTTL